MNTEKKAFKIGLACLFVAIFSITILPFIVKKLTPIYFSEYFFTQVEFFLLFWCACLFAYSSKYYKYQILSILGALFLYFIYLKVYDLVL